MLARQGDWMRVAQLLINDGNYRGDEVIHPGWVPHMLIPAQDNPGYGSYVQLAKAQATGTEPFAADDLFERSGLAAWDRIFGDAWY